MHTLDKIALLKKIKLLDIQDYLSIQFHSVKSLERHLDLRGDRAGLDDGLRQIVGVGGLDVVQVAAEGLPGLDAHCVRVAVVLGAPLEVLAGAAAGGGGAEVAQAPVTCGTGANSVALLSCLRARKRRCLRSSTAITH